jgi:hypothetical protein
MARIPRKGCSACGGRIVAVTPGLVPRQNNTQGRLPDEPSTTRLSCRPLARSYVIFLGWSVSALVTALWIEDLSGYRHRKTAISTEFSQLRSTATGSCSNFGLVTMPAYGCCQTRI